MRQGVPDGSATARAIDYSLKRWAARVRFISAAELPIDNNWVENRIRRIVLGRQNWLFAGSLRAGKRAAAVMRLVQSRSGGTQRSFMRQLHLVPSELACGLMNLQHLKLLSVCSDLYRHRITLAFAQHGPAQRGSAADDLNQLGAASQLHAAPIRAEKELLLLVVGIDQADQRAELYAFAGVVGARAELAPMGHRLADGFGATSLAGGQVGCFESQCVVFVFGDVFFVSRRFMGRSRSLFGLQQVLG
jgi:Transposase IS66 family